MFKGFLSGLFWGGMVGALVLAVLSLYAPLSSSQADAGAGVQAPAAVAETEGATSEDKMSENTEPDLPDVDDTPAPENAPLTSDETTAAPEQASPVTEEDSSSLTAPLISEDDADTAQVTPVAPEITAIEIDADEVVAAAENTLPETDDLTGNDSPDVTANLEGLSFSDTTDINSVKLPQVSDEGVETPSLPNAITAEVDEAADRPLIVSDKPIDALPVAVLKTAPDALGFSSDVSVLSVPLVSEGTDEAPTTTTTALVAPVISELGPKPVESPAVVRVAVRPTKRATQLPQIGGTPPLETTEVSADTPIGVQVPQIDNPVSPNAVQVVTGRLPTIGGANDGAVKPVLTSVAPDPASLGALSDHAATFTTNAQSLFSIVIIDVGQDGVAREQLLNSSYPITVAIDPSVPNAAGLMREYRAAGIEVVALLNDLPTSAAPSDVAVAVSGYFGVLDQAVAVMEPLDRRLQRDRNLLQPVLGALSDTGHGFMTYAQGLNTAQQSAKRSGVPSAAVFRVLDAEGERSAKIKRYLKRAAFNAGRDGSVVVVGRSYAETMTAILEWALESNDASLSLAPISAVLKADLS